MKERILLIGSGGREMALTLALLASPSCEKIIVAPGSDAIAKYASCHPVAANDIEGLVKLAQEEEISLCIVGPELPLSLGITDRLESLGIAVFGPTKRAAQIECSKAYAKKLMQEAGVPTAAFRHFTSREAAFKALDEVSYPLVLKEDGLRSGKGVHIVAGKEEAERTLLALEITESSPLLFEEFLQGYEFSLIVLAQGDNFICLPIAQDYKAIYDGQEGPNTGGMGAVSPVPKVTPALVEESVEKVIKPVLKALIADDAGFCGFLYAGLMATEKGVQVIEFNARLGDPESEVILPLVEGDLVKAIREIRQAGPGELQGTSPLLKIKKACSLGVVLSAPGYPGTVTESVAIPREFFDKAEAAGLSIVHMGTRIEGETCQSTGGRVLIVLAQAADISAARKKVYDFLEKEAALIEKLHYRTDIGLSAL